MTRSSSTSLNDVDAINPTSKLPLYQQIYDILHKNIMQGKWKPDFMIPPESELI